jgi:hypothetical protein
VAALRRTPAGRGRPVTLTPVSGADSGRPDSMDTRPRWRKRRRTADAAAASGSAATWTPPRGEYPAVRTASPGGRSSGTTADTLAVSAGGGVPCGGHPGPGQPVGGGSAAAADPPAAACAHGRSRRAYRTVGYRGRHVPPCSGAAAVSAVDSGRPARTRPHSQPRHGHGRGVRFRGHCWGSGPGWRSRRTSTVRTRGQRTRLADTASPQAPGTADTCEGGRVVRTLRQRHAGQPAAQPSTATPNVRQERDRKVRHRPAPPWPDRQIRSLVALRRSGRLQTDLACSGWMPRRSGRIQWGPVGSSG